ncbi:MAG: hypothetical protein ACTHK8_12925 [Ginsengibacter sp.]
MATQYSILSVVIRPEIQEKISAGLLLFDESEIYFSYSRNKINACKSLLPASSFKMVKDVLESIENKIDSDNAKYSEKRGFKIFQNKIFDNTFSASYVSYLSRYSNNLIGFTSPKEIYLALNRQNFEKLFTTYVDEVIEFAEAPRKIKLVEEITDRYGNRLKEHYDINREVTPDKVKNLITPVRVDFTGRNEVDVYAQTVDMEATPGTVTNNINAFVQLKTSYIKNGVPVQDFVIAKEPDEKKYPTQHNIWQQLRHSNILNYLDLSESEAIVRYAEEHGVVPISRIEK